MTNKSERAVSAMTFREFLKKFPDEKAAIDYFIDIRYEGNLTCPHCGATVSIYRYRDRPKFFQCSTCQNTFSPFKDTIFEKTHIGIREWFYAIKLFLNSRKGISGCQLVRELGVAYSTAWRMLQQIRIAMKNDTIKLWLKGIVEADETYVGGKPKKENSILGKDGNVVRKTKPNNKRGRGTKKTPVFGLKERETGKVHAEVMEPNEEGKKLTGKQLYAPIKENVEEGSTIMTDEFSSYDILDKKRQKGKYKHETVNHSKDQYYAGNGIHTNGIENFWSVFKRGIIGIYHHTWKEYLQRYVDEFVFRQNTRLDKSMFNVLMKQCILV